MAYVKRTTTISGTWNTLNGVTVTGKRIAFLTHMPTPHSNGRLPALIIYLHGVDHVGPAPTGPTDYGTLDIVADKGIPSLIVSGEIPPVTRPGGATPADDYKFAVMAPQLSDEFSVWSIAYPIECLNWANTNWAGQFDPNRIYVIGYSLGGGGVLAYIGNSNASKIAWFGAIAPGYAGSTDYISIAGRKAPITLFHCKNDLKAPVSISRTFVNGVNKLHPKAPIQYFEFNDLTTGSGTQHDRIIQLAVNQTEGTNYPQVNGDVWTQRNLLKMALGYSLN